MKRYSVFIFSILFIIIVDTIYLTTYEIKPMYLVATTSLCLIPILFKVLNKYLKLNLSLLLEFSVTLHALFSYGLGTMLDVYHMLSFWDLLMHFYFGVNMIFILIDLSKFVDFKTNKVIYYIILVILTLGVASIWEIIEYTSDNLFGLDMQRVNESLANGINPIKDTMDDVIIAIPGAILGIIINEIKLKYCSSPLNNFNEKKEIN